MRASSLPFPTLIAELAHPNSWVRNQAISSIMRRRNERGQAFASLLALLDDPDGQVCKAAIKALGRPGDPRVIPALRPFRTHQKARFRRLALRTAVLLDRQQALPHLFTALHDRTSSIRNEAIGIWDTVVTVESLIVVLGDVEWEVLEWGAGVLSTLGDARAVEPLIAALDDVDWRVRWEVTRALGQLRDARAVEPLIAALGDTEWEVRQAAVMALGTLGDTRAVEPLIAALGDAKSWIRRKVARVLGTLGDARAVEPLHTLLADPFPEVIQQAREAIAQLEGLV